MSREEKPDLFWSEDSSGASSCHINAPNLSFKDSLIGTLVWKDSMCHPVLKNGMDIGGFLSASKARRELELFYRKAILSVREGHKNEKKETID